MAKAHSNYRQGLCTYWGHVQRAQNLALGLWLLASCKSAATFDENSYLRANVISDVLQSTYNGPSYFVTTDAAPGRLPDFTLTSTRNNGDSEEAFVMQRVGGGVIGPGRYPLGLLEAAGANRDAFTMVYWKTAAAYESFVSVGGEVIVTASSNDHFEGTFRMTGALFCRRFNASVEGSCTPSTVSPGAKQIEVNGSFSARRPSVRQVPD